MSAKTRVQRWYPAAYSYYDGVGTGRRWFIKGHHRSRPSVYGQGTTPNGAWCSAENYMTARINKAGRIRNEPQ